MARYVASVVALAAKASSSGGCGQCQFYRAEPGMLLQGVIAHHHPPPSAASSKGEDNAVAVWLGPCPVDDYVPKNECPMQDPDCGCHGPVMTRGMVGWAVRISS